MHTDKIEISTAIAVARLIASLAPASADAIARALTLAGDVLTAPVGSLAGPHWEVDRPAGALRALLEGSLWRAPLLAALDAAAWEVNRLAGEARDFAAERTLRSAFLAAREAVLWADTAGLDRAVAAHAASAGTSRPPSDLTTQRDTPTVHYATSALLRWCGVSEWSLAAAPARQAVRRFLAERCAAPALAGQQPGTEEIYLRLRAEFAAA